MEQVERAAMPSHEAAGVTPKTESETESKAEVAKDTVKHVAAETEQHVGELAREAWGQAREVMGRATGAARTQADQQTARAASGLMSLSDQLRALSDGRSAEAGDLGQYAGKAGEQLARFSRRLEAGGIQGLFDDISRFARRRPGQFVLLAAGAGFIAGRAVRAGQAAAKNPQDQSDVSSSAVPYEPDPGSRDAVPLGASAGGGGSEGDSGVAAPLPPPAVGAPIGDEPAYRAGGR
jgi:uncharacterized protein YjbJ (UPF0337 family)